MLIELSEQVLEHESSLMTQFRGLNMLTFAKLIIYGESVEFVGRRLADGDMLVLYQVADVLSPGESFLGDVALSTRDALLAEACAGP